jgi:hypothetical protein
MTTTGTEAFPATADEFYRRRDHRTNEYREVEPCYADRVVWVTAEAGCLEYLSGQVTFLTTCNLLARWCRQVAITIDDVAVHQSLRAEGSLVPHAMNIMLDADPFGNFTTELPGRPDLHIHIGERPPQVEARSTVLTCADWLAGVRRPSATGLPMRPSDNPVGAACAAVLGGAQVFRDALNRSDLFPAEFVFDAFTGAPTSADAVSAHTVFTDLTIGRVLVTGAGSVSSAALFFADLFRIGGVLDLVDADRVKIENFGRSPLFGKKMFGAEKVYALASVLSGRSLQIAPIAAWWHEAGLSPGLMGYDLLLPLANEHGIRWDLQNRVPPLMIHASTGRNWNVNFGRHIPGRDDCLADRFEGLEEKPSFKCSGGQIQIDGDKPIDAALPFLSFFAGLLIAIDLVRLSIPGYPQTPNYGNYSFRANRFAPRLLDVGPRAGCICTTQGDLFWKMRGNTRHAHLSVPARH